MSVIATAVDGGGSAAPASAHSFFAPIVSTSPLLYEKAMTFFKEYSTSLDGHLDITALFNDGK